MAQGGLTAATIEEYLQARPRWMLWREWLSGRRYRFANFAGQPRPLVIMAHSFRDAAQAGRLAQAVESDWVRVPAHCREVY